MHSGVPSEGVPQVLERNSGDVLLHSSRKLSPDTAEGLAGSKLHIAGSDVGSKETVSDTFDEEKLLSMVAISPLPDPEPVHQVQTGAQRSRWSVPVVCGTSEEIPVELQSQ